MINNENTRNAYTLNGSATHFAYEFKIFAAADLQIVKRLLDGSEQTINYPADCSVTGAGTENGGEVILNDPGTAGEILVIRRNLPKTQPFSFRDQPAFYGERHEDGYDRTVMLLQQLTEETTRSIQLPVTFTGTAELDSLVDGYAVGMVANGDGSFRITPVASSGASQVADLANTASTTKGTGMVGHNDALSYPAGTAGAFLNRLKDYANATYGAAMTGFAYALAYGANTVGAAIKAVMDRSTTLEAKKQIQPITASVAGNNLTVTLNPCVLEFRDAALTSGTVNQRVMGAAISLVIPNTATLGTVNAVSARLALVAIDNAGTVELAIVNLAGGNQLDETNLISTTAISTAADSNNVFYSASARTNVPYRVVGFIDITEATAGTWATAPSVIQGQGGQALAALQSIGYGQTWQNVAGSRAAATTYYNTTGRPIQVIASFTTTGAANSSMTINGVTFNGGSYGAAGGFTTVQGIVPPGGSYSATNSAGTVVNSWVELR